MAKTKKPGKPSIARNGRTFTASWTPLASKDHLSDQNIRVFVNGGKVEEKDLKPNGWSKSGGCTGGISKSYSYILATTGKFTSVGFARQQKVHEKTISDWSSTATFNISVPNRPGYVKPEKYNNLSNVFKYAFGTDHGDNGSGGIMFRNFVWETCLVDADQGPNWGLVSSQRITRKDASSGVDTNSASFGYDAGPVIIVESNADITAKKRRYFRAKAVGPAGESLYSPEAWHQYGGRDPYVIQPEHITYNGQSSTGVSGQINLSAIKTYPDDIVQIQYAMTNPFITEEVKGDWSTRALTLPNDFSGWVTDGNGFSANNMQDVYTFNYPINEQDDQRLFIRVNVIHDDVTYYGVPALISSKAEAYTYSIISYEYNSKNKIRVNEIKSQLKKASGALYERLKRELKSIQARSNKITTTQTAYNVKYVPGTLSKPIITSLSINSEDEVTIGVKNKTSFPTGGNKSFIAVYLRTEKELDPVKPVCIIPYEQEDATVSFPIEYDEGETPSIGIKCLACDYTPLERDPEGMTEYNTDNVLMESDFVWWEGGLPLPPRNLKVERPAGTTQTVLLTWDWTWAEADSAEITWSTDPNIWDSVSEPSSYILTNTKQGKRYITGLSADTYYFRVRFIKTEGETVVYGSYASVNGGFALSSAPAIPTITLSTEDQTVTQDEEVVVSWIFESTDGTGQASAELAEATRETPNSDWVYTKIDNVSAGSEGQIIFTPEQVGWSNDSTHYIAVRVTSTSGQVSGGWSNPVAINIAALPEISIDGIGGQNDALKPINIQSEGEQGPETITIPLALTRLPLDFQVNGAGQDGSCSVIIEREDDFVMERPDDSKFKGYAGETIIAKTFTKSVTDVEEGEDWTDTIDVSIGIEDLLGELDNSAIYRLIISITDKYGQTVSTEKDDYIFQVYWDYNAHLPYADIEIDMARDIALITPRCLETPDAGDYCRIYRLSADTPQLIMAHAEFDTQYVDEYPTYGIFGGYRIVYVNKYGDYKTSDNSTAWVDYTPHEIDEEYIISSYDKFFVTVDFDDDYMEFKGNISLSHSWAKDFQQTKYLGGSIQGDWNPGVSRSGSINGVIPVEQERDMLYQLRRLADYAGLCHVRTPDGSNFYGDVQIKDDREEKLVNKLSKISLTYTRVDDIAQELPTYEAWEDGQ